MQFTICPKHNKIQKVPHKVTTNCYICMNRYCQQSFIPLCNQCKPQHRDHSNKLLTLQDITFLIQRLLKSPFKQLSTYIYEAVSVMKKFKLVQQNKKKIQLLQKQIYTEVMGLVQGTQGLIHEYAKCKNKVGQLGELLVNVQLPQSYKFLTSNSQSLLSNLQYNYQKDKFEYGNQLIRQKYQIRRKSYERTRRKLQQVKDYSMKIIEVILANDQSQQQQEDIVYKKKMYEILKRQLEQKVNHNQHIIKLNTHTQSKNISITISDNKNIQEKNELEVSENKELTVSNKKGQQILMHYQTNNHQSSHCTQIGNQHSNSISLHVNQQKLLHTSQQQKLFNVPQQKSTNYSMISQDRKTQSTAITNTFLLPSTQSSTILSIQKSSQTNPQWLKAIQQTSQQYQLKIKRLQQSNAKSMNQLQNKIAILVRQKQTIKKQYSSLQQKYHLKNQKILQIEKKLRQNKQKRLLKQKQKQTKLQKLIQIANWKSIIQGDAIG